MWTCCEMDVDLPLARFYWILGSIWVLKSKTRSLRIRMKHIDACNMQNTHTHTHTHPNTLAKQALYIKHPLPHPNNTPFPTTDETSRRGTVGFGGNGKTPGRNR